MHGRKGKDHKWSEEREIREAFMWRRRGRKAGTFSRGRKKGRSKVCTHANIVRMESEHTSCCHLKALGRIVPHYRT